MSNEYSISFFKQILRSPATVNRYRITINNKYFNEIQNYFVFAKEVALPGQSLDVANITIQGSKRNVPQGMDYDPITITFVCDKELKPRIAIQKWMDESIFNKDKYVVSFLDDFICNIYIELFNRKNEKVFKIELQEAWPKDMSEVQLGYDNDQAFEFNTTFEYYAWRRIE